MVKNLKIRIFAGVIISAAIIYFTVKALGGLNPYLLLNADINWFYAFVSAVVFAFSVFIRALVYPFGIDRKLGIMEAFSIVGVGNAANMLLPLRGGEVIRGGLFPKKYSLPKRSWLITVPAVIDMLAILAISELALPVSGFSNPAIVNVLHIVSSIYLLAITILIILLFCIPHFKLTAEHFVSGSIFKASMWVFFSWIIMLASIVFGMMAYGYNASDSIKMSFAIFAATNIVMLIPSTPGGLGLFEYGVVLGLEGFGITRFPAKEIGMLLHLIQYAALLPLGLWLYVYGIRQKHADRGSIRGRKARDVMRKNLRASNRTITMMPLKKPH